MEQEWIDWKSYPPKTIRKIDLTEKFLDALTLSGVHWRIAQNGDKTKTRKLMAISSHNPDFSRDIKWLKYDHSKNELNFNTPRFVIRSCWCPDPRDLEKYYNEYEPDFCWDSYCLLEYCVD